MKQEKKIADEKLLRYTEKILVKRGEKALEMVRQTVLEEKLECREVQEALQYFITEYWYDLARPTLLSLCCEAAGGKPDATIPFAVPLSLISGALDIQDDIIDQSKTKHGRPTVYGKYGKEIALLAAGALLFKGFTLLQKACMQIPTEKATKIIDLVKNMFYELGDAEAMELKLRGRLDITEKEYLHIVRKKAADVEAHARIGAILGNATTIEEENLANYGRLLGMVIIIRDDILDSLDTKELKHRMTREHIPLPLIYALEKEKIARYRLPPNVSLKEFCEEKIETGIEQCNNLLRKLINEAFIYIKDAPDKHKYHLNLILKAFKISLIENKKRRGFSPTSKVE